MSATVQPGRMAWEPLTPRGVASFAWASFGRLALVQLLVALLAAGSVVWFLEKSWFPIIRTAIQQLPAQGDISHGKLHWQGTSPAQLAQNSFLGFSVDLFHSGLLGHEPHLQFEFGQEDMRVYSLLDYQIISYPPEWQTGFNQTEVEPWWGAWHPFILLGVATGIVVGLTILWPVLATIYCIPVWVISFLENRDLGWGQSWRLAGATTMPGILFLTAGIIGYSFGWMDLIRLGGVAGLSFVIGWIYLFVSPLFCPKATAETKAAANPFATSPASDEKKQTRENRQD